CLLSILRILDLSNEITLGNIVNECTNLDIQHDSAMNQQKSGEHNCANRISSEIVSQNIPTLRKTLTES
ncbi:unnamed protein product, partial [Hymenolepis diminuta]